MIKTKQPWKKQYKILPLLVSQSLSRSSDISCGQDHPKTHPLFHTIIYCQQGCQFNKKEKEFTEDKKDKHLYQLGNISKSSGQGIHSKNMSNEQIFNIRALSSPNISSIDDEFRRK